MTGSWAGTSKPFLEPQDWNVDCLRSMVVLGGVDSSNDGMGRQKATRIQKGVWERVSPSEESHDTFFVLNLWGSGRYPVSFGSTLP